jgi:glucokinase
MASLLAGYISGSAVDLARVTERGGVVRLVSHRRYLTRDFPDFDSILKLHLRKSRVEFNAASFGVSGPVIDRAVSTNLGWRITMASLKKKFGFRDIMLINDVVATAHSLPQLDTDRFFTIHSGAASARGNQGLIAAGSGLGEALIFANGYRALPNASEGGHGAFAPTDQLEVELWQYLYSELGQVEVEDVVSLRGLENIFNFLVDTRGGQRGSWLDKADDPPGQIIERALAGKDKTASEALDLFIDCYASEAANLALKGMTLGGIYIGGLIAPQIITVLDRGRFMKRFVKKGRMERMLARIPVRVIIEDKAALLGAAIAGLTL